MINKEMSNADTDPYAHYHRVMYQSLCDEIGRRTADTTSTNRKAFLRIMRGLVDDDSPMPSQEQVLSVSSPVVRFVFAEVLTRWDHASAASFRRDVFNHMKQSFPMEEEW